MVYLAIAKDIKIWDAKKERQTPPKNVDQLFNSCIRFDSLRTLEQKIDKLVLLNFENVSVTPKGIEKYVQDELTDHRIDHAEAELLRRMVIVTPEDIGIKKGDVPRLDNINYSFTGLEIGKIYEIIGSDSVFTHLGYHTPLIFQIILSLQDKPTVFRDTYRLSTRASFSSFTEEEMYDFFNFTRLINGSVANSNHGIPATFNDCFTKKANILSAQYADTASDNFHAILAGNIKIAILIGDDDSLIKHLLLDLERIHGKFIRQRASEQESTVFTGQRMFISDIDLLSTKAFNILMNQIGSIERDDTFILLQSRKPLTAVLDSKIKSVYLPGREILEIHMSAILKFLFNEHFGISGLRASMRDGWYYLNNPTIYEIFRNIRSISGIENEIINIKTGESFPLHDFNDELFWWEFKNYIDEKYPSMRINDSKQRTSPEPANILVKSDLPVVVPTITFNHEKNSQYWDITFTGFDEESFLKKYSDAFKEDFGIEFISSFRELYNIRALFYIVYLTKFCEISKSGTEKSIGYKELYNKGHHWSGSKKKSNNVSPNVIQRQVKSYFDVRSTRNSVNRDDILDATRRKKERIAKFRSQLGLLVEEYLVIKKECYSDFRGKIKVIVNDDNIKLPASKK